MFVWKERRKYERRNGWMRKCKTKRGEEKSESKKTARDKGCRSKQEVEPQIHRKMSCRIFTGDVIKTLKITHFLLSFYANAPKHNVYFQVTKPSGGHNYYDLGKGPHQTIIFPSSHLYMFSVFVSTR